MVAPERVEKFLKGLPVDALWGVGPVTAAKLREHGIEKLTDVRARSRADLEAIVGSLAPWLIDLAHGRDDRRVEPNRPAKSSSSERTYASDLSGMSEIRQEIDKMARDVAGWLQKRAITARTVTIKVRYDDFTTVTRSHSTPQMTDDARCHRLARARRCWRRPRPARGPCACSASACTTSAPTKTRRGRDRRSATTCGCRFAA